MSNTPNRRLFLVDAYALIFRGYYALIKNPRINSKGEDTSAVMGFMNSLLDLIRKENPEYLAVCFDKGGSVERTELFEDYKANRESTPEAIKFAVPHIQALLTAMHIPVIVKEGYEADDLIGTLSKQAEKEDFTVYMVTPDKDFGQLVSENIFMYRPARGGGDIEIWGIPEIQERFGVKEPKQVIDYLGMMGDASDNIPGFPGVGDKTAKKLIEQYGSLENLLKNTHELKGKLKERIEENAELGLLSKELATIKIDCDVHFDPASFELSEPDIEKVTQLFEVLEFRRMKDQFVKTFSKSGSDEENTSTPVKEEKTAVPGSGQFSLFDTNQTSDESKVTSDSSFYQVINSPGTFSRFIKVLETKDEISLSFSYDDIDAFEPQIIAIGFSWESHKAYYLDLSDERELKLEKLRSIFASDKKFIGQELKTALKSLIREGIDLNGNLFDTLLAHYLINPDMRHDRKVLSETYLRKRLELHPKGKFSEWPEETKIKVLCEDADIGLQLYQHFKLELQKDNLKVLFEEIEIPLLRVLAQMELNGIRLDTPYLSELNSEFSSQIEKLESQIYEQAGKTFNIGSPKQLGIVLFENLQLSKKPKKTKTGQYATGEDILTELAKEHQIAKDILAYRSLTKLKSTYVDALPQQVNPNTQRVHTEFMQTVAATGRLSSVNPNLQNIPIRTAQGRRIRQAFIAKDEDHILLAADYSQIELRIIAALSEENTMMAAFESDQDIHADTASRVFNVAIDAVTREQRSQAKTVNFGILYGVSAFGLSNQTNLSRSESKELIELYYKTYPKLTSFIADQVAHAREEGYVSTVMGRKRYLAGIQSSNAIVRSAAERNAINAPIQGSAADIIKKAMIDIHAELQEKKMKSKMLLQVHDELVFDAHKNEVEALKKLITERMENAFKLPVKLKVDIGWGTNWLEAH